MVVVAAVFGSAVAAVDEVDVSGPVSIVSVALVVSVVVVAVAVVAIVLVRLWLLARFGIQHRSIGLLSSDLVSYVP